MKMGQTSQTLKYSEENGCYVLSTDEDPVEVISADEEDMCHWFLEEYDEIFEEYDEDLHNVHLQDMESGTYLGLSRTPRQTDRSTHPLPPGLYEMEMMEWDPAIKTITIPDPDCFVPIHNKAPGLVDEMVNFFHSRDVYDDLEIRHKRGALIYGPPGNGKTLNLMRAARRCIKEFDCAVFMVTTDTLDLLSTFRDLFEDQPTICIFEEITEFTARDMESVLNILDGERSWTNNYNVATTNHPGKLPANLVDRPGRFDRIIRVPNPDRADRRMFLEHFVSPDEITSDLLEQTRGFSVAYLMEAVLASRLYDQTLSDVLSQFQRHKKRIKDAFKDPEDQVGFMKYTTNGTPETA